MGVTGSTAGRWYAWIADIFKGGFLLALENDMFRSLWNVSISIMRCNSDFLESMDNKPFLLKLSFSAQLLCNYQADIRHSKVVQGRLKLFKIP